MPTLNWIGKEKVVNHHMDVPYRPLKKQYTFNAENSDNMIIHGDNLEALKALLPKYEGKIDVIYIDPPYNTGNEGWVYNDNVNDPRIRRWIGQVVGQEGEDLCRHDKWLCMMYPRLVLLQKLMKQNGIMVISIGFQELQNLLSICREIFGSKQIVTVTVQTSGGKPSGGFTLLHEYLVFVVPPDFSPNVLNFCGGVARSPFEGLTLATFDKTQRPNQTYPIFVDKNTGAFVSVGKSLQELIDSGEYKGSKSDYKYDYSIAPDGCVAIWPVTSKGKECVWRQIPGRLANDWNCGYIKISRNKNSNSKNMFSIQYLPSGVIEKIENGILPILGREKNCPTLVLGDNTTVGGQIPTIWTEKEFHTAKGTALMKEIFNDRESSQFSYPKPLLLVKSIIQACSSKDSIVLDSFAGSGTTAHAVLNLNKEDGGNRKFILCELGDYAETTTAERVRRVINGYGEGNNVVFGTSGDFSFYELGEPIIKDGNINPDVTEEELRKFIYYSETRTDLPEANPEDPTLLGVHNGIAFYLHYSGNCCSILDRDYLRTLKTKADSYVIYAGRCTLSEAELEKFGITFKKTSRDVRAF